MTGLEAVVVIVLGLALVVASVIADARRRHDDGDDLAGITLDEAVAVVLDSFARDDDDVVQTVTIDRRTNCDGLYAVQGQVTTGADGVAVLYRRHTVYVPDDLDEPVGLSPRDQARATFATLPPPIPLNSGCSLADAIADHEPTGPTHWHAVPARPGAQFGRIVDFPGAACPLPLVLVGVHDVGGLERDVADGAQAHGEDVPVGETEPVPARTDVELVERAADTDEDVAVSELESLAAVVQPVALASTLGRRGQSDVGLLASDDHGASPSVRTVPGATGPVVGAAALDTPPAGDPTVGDDTGTSDTPSSDVSVSDLGGGVCPRVPAQRPAGDES